MNLLIGRGRRNTARLLATGQVTSYGSGTGVDDGALKKGIVKRYTILTTGQYSGTTAILINGKTDAHSNNCVFDDHTGLMWSRYASASVGPASNGLIPWTTTGSGTTAEGIFPYCAAAVAASLAGYTDWRVPNAYELGSIMHREATNTVPDVTAFPSWVASSYYSSTSRYSAQTSAIQVNFDTVGQITTLTKTINAYVVLVRGG
jgi:hypothetical protein